MITRFIKASKSLRDKRNSKRGVVHRGLRRHTRRFERLEDRCLLAASPPLLGMVEGFSMYNSMYDNMDLVTEIEPPSPNGAVGPTHILNVANQSIQWFTKDGGVQHMQTSLKNFFAPLRPDDVENRVLHPKTLYDQFANRFVVTATEVYDQGEGHLYNMSRFLVAVSDDSDPNGTWYYRSINTQVNVPDVTDPGVFLPCWTGDPGFALDEEAIYLTGNLFEFDSGFDDPTPHGNRLWIMDKGLGKGGFYDTGTAPASAIKMYDPSGLTGVDFTGNYTVEQDLRTMQPAHVFGTAPTGVGTWLVLFDGLNNGVDEYVDIIRVDNPLTTPTFRRFTINVGDIEENTINPLFDIQGLAAQRGSADQLDFGDRRIVSAVWRDNALYATTVIYPAQGDDANQITAHWFKFDTNHALGPKLVDQGSIGGEELGFAVHTGWPVVSVDVQGNMAVSFAAAGPNLYAGAYYAVRAAGDPAGEFRTPRTLAAGLDVYETDDLLWGEYSGIALDPTDGVTFWAYNAYALPRLDLDGQWGTRWGSFRLGDGPVTPVPGPTTISGVVWHDRDENRRRDTTEPGLGGWTIYADLDGDGKLDLGEPTAKTDSVGRYSLKLDNVTGSLTIREALKPGWKQTFPGGTALAHVLTVTGDGPIKDVNFGNSDNDGFDHGDAPPPYPTLKANNGPSHAITPGFGLGVEAADGSTVVVDGEPDGLPDANALGDDNDNYDDENGVVFATGLMPGRTATLTVTVSLGTNAAGMLQGWIDFNRDGDWADAGEQVFKNLTLGAGVHTLTVDVPSTAIPGTTFARFRYGYEKDLSYVGPSYAGEVEDYRVDILSEKPNAVDDRFFVDQNSRDNFFYVLANDVPGANGITKLRIRELNMTGASGTATIDRNGTENDFTDDFIRYTPRAGAVGPDAFFYTVEDVMNGTTDTATVSVTITQAQGDAPVAVDDSYLVPPPPVDPALLDVPSDPYLFNVLKNDQWGPTGVRPTISSWDASGLVGTVTLVQNIGGTGAPGFRYNPNGFVGTEQFTYTIMDLNGATSTGRVTVQTGTARTSDDLVRIRLETRDMSGNLITQIGQGMQFQVYAYVRDMRNVAGYQSVPGFPPQDQGVFSAYMDLLYDSDLVSFAGTDRDTDWPYYSQGHHDTDPNSPTYGYPFYDAGVPGIVDEIGAYDGANADGTPYGAGEKLLYKATFTASDSKLGTARFKSDPAEVLPLHETALNRPGDTAVDYPQIDFRATTINVVESPDLVQIRLEATTLAGASLANGQITPGTEFYVKAWVDDLGIRSGIPSFPSALEGVYSAYLDINYNSALVRPVAVPTSVNPLGFDITAGAMFPDGLKGINRDVAGIVDEVGAYQGGSARLFSNEQLLFQIRFRALGGAGGTVIFDANEAEEVVNETTLIKPDPGVSVPTAQIRFVDSAPLTVSAGSGEGEFTNPFNRYDVNNDGYATPADALALVNFLNSSGTTDLSQWAAGGEGEAGRLYYDVNSDWIVSPADVLGVINYLNSVAVQPTGEGEAVASLAAASLLPAESRSASGLPLGDQLNSSSANPVAATESASANWLPEKPEERDYFAIAGAKDAVELDAALEPLLSDALAGDIAGAWGQDFSLDLLPDAWV